MASNAGNDRSADMERSSLEKGGGPSTDNLTTHIPGIGNIGVIQYLGRPLTEAQAEQVFRTWRSEQIQS